MISIAFSLLFPFLTNSIGVREVNATSCDVVSIKVGIGMVTQLVFEMTPTQTLIATDQQFKITSSQDSPRSVAIIPAMNHESISQTMKQQGVTSIKEMVSLLDKTYSTNLFVFFKNENQLQFRLRLVPKEESDSIVKIRQIFKKDCRL